MTQQKISGQSIRDIGLGLFVAMIAVGGSAILFDCLLVIIGIPTITVTIRHNWVLSIPIIVGLVLGIIGLIVHLFWPLGEYCKNRNDEEEIHEIGGYLEDEL
jgi:hypothetical protein